MIARSIYNGIVAGILSAFIIGSIFLGLESVGVAYVDSGLMIILALGVGASITVSSIYNSLAVARAFSKIEERIDDLDRKMSRIENYLNIYEEIAKENTNTIEGIGAKIRNLEARVKAVEKLLSAILEG